MLTAEAPDIDGLESAHSPVVLDLNPGETAEDIGHLGRWRHGGGQVRLFNGPDHRKDLDGPDGSRSQRVRFLGFQSPGNRQDEGQRYEPGLPH